MWIKESTMIIPPSFHFSFLLLGNNSSPSLNNLSLLTLPPSKQITLQCASELVPETLRLKMEIIATHMEIQ
jgi:hypothetical protein